MRIFLAMFAGLVLCSAAIPAQAASHHRTHKVKHHKAKKHHNA
jgi:hypothetical protein